MQRMKVQGRIVHGLNHGCSHGMNPEYRAAEYESSGAGDLLHWMVESIKGPNTFWDKLSLLEYFKYTCALFA